MKAADARTTLVAVLLGVLLLTPRTWATPPERPSADRSDAALADAAPLIVIGRLLQDPGAGDASRLLLVERTLKGQAPDILDVRLPLEVTPEDEQARLLLFLEPQPEGFWTVVGGARGALRDEPGRPEEPAPRHFAMFADWIAARAEAIHLAPGYLAAPASDSVAAQEGQPPPPLVETAPAPAPEQRLPASVAASAPTPVALVEPPPADGPVVPPPVRPLLLGYVFSDGRYGDYRDEVGCYTNLYHAWARRGYELSDSSPDNEWLGAMMLGLRDAATAGQKILLHLNLQDRQPGRTTPIDRVLAVAAPYWDRVVAIELADEPDWSRETAEVWAAHVRELIGERGLADRMLGVVIGGEAALATDLVQASGIDFVTLEAYLEPPGDASPMLNELALESYVYRVLARLPYGKKAILLMMAYTRNGAWTNLATLAELQTATYRVALREPRILALTMFAYGRPSGTREHPELRSRHVSIARSLGIEACSTAPPIALRADSVSGSRPLRVSFEAELQDAPSCGALFLWDLGDGTRVGGVERCCLESPRILPRRTLSIVHQYERPGVFTPMLRFNDLRSSRPTIVVEPY